MLVWIKIIAKAEKIGSQNEQDSERRLYPFKKMKCEGTIYPDCRNTSNPYHECSEFCFKIIAEAKKLASQNEQDSERHFYPLKKVKCEGTVYSNCRNASNPYHECCEFCLNIIAEAKKLAYQNEQDSERHLYPLKKMKCEGTVYSDCRNASNPYHECSEFCFKIIAEAKKLASQNEQDSERHFYPLKKVKCEGTVYSNCRNASNPYHECC